MLCLVGLVVGLLARLALPGRDPMSIWQTIAIGIAGSVVAGGLSLLLFGRWPGMILAVACSAFIVYLVRRSRGGGLMDPGTPPGIDR